MITKRERRPLLVYGAGKMAVSVRVMPGLKLLFRSKQGWVDVQVGGGPAFKLITLYPHTEPLQPWVHDVWASTLPVGNAITWTCRYCAYRPARHPRLPALPALSTSLVNEWRQFMKTSYHRTDCGPMIDWLGERDDVGWLSRVATDPEGLLTELRSLTCKTN